MCKKVFEYTTLFCAYEEINKRDLVIYEIKVLVGVVCIMENCSYIHFIIYLHIHNFLYDCSLLHISIVSKMLALKTTFSMSIIILLVSTSFIKSVQSEDTLEDHTDNESNDEEHHRLQIINIVGGTGASLYCPKMPNSDDEFEICEIEHISEHRSYL